MVTSLLDGVYLSLLYPHWSLIFDISYLCVCVCVLERFGFHLLFFLSVYVGLCVKIFCVSCVV